MITVIASSVDFQIESKEMFARDDCRYFYSSCLCCILSGFFLLLVVVLLFVGVEMAPMSIQCRECQPNCNGGFVVASM